MTSKQDKKNANPARREKGAKSAESLCDACAS